MAKKGIKVNNAQNNVQDVVIKSRVNFIIKILLLVIIAFIVMIYYVINQRAKTVSLENNKFDFEETEVSIDKTLDDKLKTIYIILNQVDYSNLNISGNVLKITNSDNISITPLNAMSDKIIQLNEDGNIIIPEEGVKLKVDGIELGNRYDIQIENIHNVNNYEPTFKKMTFQIETDENGEIKTSVKNITKEIDGEEKVEEGSAENTAMFMYEDSNGNIKITENNELQLYYTISDSNGLTSEELQKANWKVYSKKEGVNITTNGIIYARSKYKNGEYSEINKIYINNIDKLKPEVEKKTIVYDRDKNEASVTFEISDQEATKEYGKSGLYGYAVTRNEIEPIDYIEVSSNEVQTVTVDGIPENGTYYMWVKDIAGNTEYTSFDITVIEEREEVSMLILQAPIKELIGTEYTTLKKLNQSLNNHNITKDSGNITVQLVKDISNESIVLNNKNIVLDLNGYTITSKLQEPTIDIIDGSLKIVDNKMEMDNYIDDSERLNLLKETYKSGDKEGGIYSKSHVAIQIESSGKLTIGEEINFNEIPNTQAPIISGKIKGISNLNGTFNYYDGVILGKVPVSGNTTDKPALYDLTVSTSDTQGIFKTILLKVSGIEALIGKTRYTKIEKAIEAIKQIQENEKEAIEIDLVSDIMKSSTINIEENTDIILDLNGYTLTYTGNDYAFTNSGKIEIKDSDGSENGKIFGTSGGAIHNLENGETILSNGKLQTTDTSTILNEGKLTITSGTINANASVEIPYGINNKNTGNVIINGGTINVTSTKEGKSSSFAYAYGIYNNENGNVNVNNAKINVKTTSKSYGYAYGIGNEGNLSLDTVEISSNYYGIFNKETGKLEANGLKSNDSTYGIYNMNEIKLIGAEISAKKMGIYNAKKMHIENINIVITQTTDSYGIYNTNTGEIDGSENSVRNATYGIYSEGTIKELINQKIIDNVYGIYVIEGATARFTNGSILGAVYGIYNEGTVVSVNQGIESNSYGIQNTETGILNKNGGSITAVDYGIYNEGTSEINDTTIIANNYGMYNLGILKSKKVNISIDEIIQNNAPLYQFLYGICNQAEGQVEFKSGTINTTCTLASSYGIYNSRTGTLTLGDQETSEDNEISVNSLTNGVYSLGDFNYYKGTIIAKTAIYGMITKMPEEYNVIIEKTDNNKEKATLGKQSGVAYINDDKSILFDNLKSAIDACGQEGKVTFVKDITITTAELATIETNQNIVIDLNGKNIRTYSQENVIYNMGRLTIKNADKNSSKIEGHSKAIIYNIGQITINNIGMSSTNLYAIDNEERGSITIDNCTIYGKSKAVYNKSEGNIIINNCTLNNGIYSNSTGKLEINDSNINATGTGIYNEGVGEIKIKKSSIILDEASLVVYGIYNENGTVTLESTNISTKITLLMNSEVYGIYNNNGNLSITGGEIIAQNAAARSIAYGVYIVGTGKAEISSKSITAKTTASKSTAYGVYNLSENEIIIQGTNVEAIVAGTSTAYGIYNMKAMSASANTIKTTSTSYNAYGIYNEKDATCIMNANNIIITHTKQAQYNGYGIYNVGQLTTENDTIESNDYYTPYGIYNEKTGNILIKDITLKANRTNTSLKYNAYGIYNNGVSNIKKGNIQAISTNGISYGIYNSTTGTLVIGENNIEEPSKTDPMISGNTFGIYNLGDFQFYDGRIEGEENNSIYGAMSSWTLNYNVSKYQNETSEKYDVDPGREITVLEAREVAHLLSTNKNYMSLSEALKESQNEDTITVLSDVSVTEKLEITEEKNIIINVNGYVITNAIEDYMIQNSGRLEIKNNTQATTKDNLVSNSYSAIYNKNAGTIKINNISMNALFSKTDEEIIYNEGTINISDSNINVIASANNNYAIFNKGNLSISNGKVTIQNNTNGTEEGYINTYGIYNEGEANVNEVNIQMSNDYKYIKLYGIYNKKDINKEETIITLQDNDITMTSSGLYTQMYGVYNEQSKLIMNNTNISQEVNIMSKAYTIFNNSNEATITGGSIKVAGAEDNNVDSSDLYAIYNTNNSNIHIESIDVTAKGTFIAPLKDTDKTYGIYNEGNIELLYSSLNVSNAFNNAYGIYNTSTGTIESQQNNITVNHTTSSANNAYGIYSEGNVKISSNVLTVNDEYTPYGIYNKNAGNINIQGVNITIGRINKRLKYNAYGIYNESTINMTEGDIQVNAEKGIAYGIYNTEKAVSTIGIKDSSVNETIPNIDSANYGIYNLGELNYYDGTINGKIAIYGSINDIEEGYSIISNNINDKESINLGNESQIAYVGNNSQKLYDDLQSAIDACGEDTITLVKNITITKAQTMQITENKNITINLNGKTITAYTKDNIIHNQGQLKLVDEANEKGKISGYTQVAIFNTDNGNVEIDGINISVSGTGIYNESTGKIVIKNSNITDGIQGIYNDNTGIIEVNNSVIKASSIGIKNNKSGEIRTTQGSITIVDDSKDGNKEKYGIYNETGSIYVDNTDISIDTAIIGASAYGIYNSQGNEVTIVSNISINSTSNSTKLYGIYNKNSQTTDVSQSHIIINADSYSSIIYGVYNLSANQTKIQNTEIRVTAPYYMYTAGANIGSTTYGVYNQGKMNIVNAQMNITSACYSAFAVYNTEKGNVTIQETDITSNHSGANTNRAYGLYNEGKATINGGTIISNDEFSSCVINNLKKATLTVKNGTLQSNHTGTATTYTSYGINNEGIATVLDGTIEANNKGTAYGIYNNNILTIGEDDGKTPKTTPTVRGKNYGVYNSGNGEFSFYDGTIQGEEYAIYGIVTNTPSGYEINYQNLMKEATLSTTAGFESAITVNGQYYESLSTAVNVISNTDTKTGTIEIHQSLINISDQVTIPEDANITIELNGNQITYDEVEIAIKNYGTLKIIDFENIEEESTNEIASIKNLNGILIMNQGILVIGKEESTNNSSPLLQGNPTISGKKPTIYSGNIMGDVIEEQTTAENKNVKAYYLTETNNDGKLVLSTIPNINISTINWTNDEVAVGMKANVMPVLDLYLTTHTTYKVEYYYDDIIDESKTDTFTAEQYDIVNSYEKKNITGYRLSKTDNYPLTVKRTEEENIIKIYYIKDTFNYKIEYYYDGSLNEANTETKRAYYLDEINKYVEKSFNGGYKLDKTENLPLTITENEDNNIIKVYYVIDESKTKDLSYKVEYYKEGELVKDDTQIKTKTVQVLQPDILDVDKEKIEKNNSKYFGYKFDKTDPEVIPDTIENNGVIKVYYIIDESQTKEISYNVEYYKEGILVPEDTMLFKKEVQVLKNYATVDKEKINLKDKYSGYKFDKTEPETIPDTIEDQGVIKVYYKVEEFEYTIEYYYEGTKDESKTETLKAKFGSEISEYIDKNISGYKLARTEGLPLTITNNAVNNIIKIYYIKDEFEYTVEYYYEGIKDNGKTEKLKARFEGIINNYQDKNITGYKFDKVEGLPLTITANSEEHIIKVFYKKEEYEYTVEYYYEGTKDNSKTEIARAKFKDIINDYQDKNITGYKLDKTEGLPLTITANPENNIIKVYYIKAEIEYTVEYYYEGVKDESKTETLKAKFENKVNNYPDKNITGYKLDKTEGLPLTITANPENNIIKVYYIKDSFEYTVEYYYEGIKDESKTEVSKAKFEDIINKYTDKNITGYKFEKTEGLPLTITAKSTDNVIKVFYKKEEYEYTVEYYYEGIKDENKTETLKAKYEDNVNEYPLKDVEGYKVGRVEGLPLKITSDLKKNIIKVYYVIDPDSTKTLSYTVEYYKDGKIVEEDTQIVKENVQILQPDIMNVKKEEINTKNKYEGYKFDSTEPNKIPETIESGSTIKVYYIIDETILKKIGYTVEYYKDGKIVEEDTQKVTRTVQILQPDTIEVNKEEINITDKYNGYVFEKTEPAKIPDTVNNGDVIKVYYVPDKTQVKLLSYTVEYYKDGTLITEDTEKYEKSVQILQPDTIEVDKDKINIKDKYEGYRVDSTIPNVIPDKIEDKGIIKVYYVIDETQTKELKYTVEYYQDGELVKNDTEVFTKTVQVLEANTIEVDKTKINTKDKYKGFELEKTIPNEIPSMIESGETIKIFYITKMKNVSYTIKYYKDNRIVEEDTEVINIKVPELRENENITVDKEKINLNKYIGYKIDEDNLNIPNTIENGGIINIYYIIDKNQTKELYYSILYYKGNDIIEEQKYKTKVQVLENDEITVDKSLINTSKQYIGYKFERTEPEIIPNKIMNKGIIKVYYSIDETQTKEVSYTVEYYKDGKIIQSDTEKYTSTVQVLQDSLPVLKKNINMYDKYKGYMFEKTEPQEIPDTIKDGSIIKVYFVPDDTVSDNGISKTGDSSNIIFIGISISMAFALISYVKYRKIKEG